MNRLHKLEVSNVQNVKDVKYTFDEQTNALVVCGKNAQGKTSLINSLIWAFCGKALIPDDPIREGESSGFAECTTDKYVVRVEFRYNKRLELVTALKVKSVSGGKEIPSPQTVLDGMLKNKTINPMSLINEHPKKLRDILVNLVNLDIDLDVHDKKRQDVFDQRTVEGRVAEQKRAYVRETPLPDNWEELPEQPLSASTLNEQYQVAVNTNAENERIRESLNNARINIDQAADKISQLTTERSDCQENIQTVCYDISEAEKETAALEAQVASLKDVDTAAIFAQIQKLQQKLENGRETNMNNKRIVDSLIPFRAKIVSSEKQKSCLLEDKAAIEEKTATAVRARSLKEDEYLAIETEVKSLADVDTETITLKIEAIQETNEAVGVVKEHFKKQREYEVQKKIYDDLTLELDKMDGEKDAAIKAAQFPVPNLSVDSKGIIYNNRSFGQASTAERIEIMVSIHLALNPEFRVIVIPDAGTLDRDSMAMLIKKAEKEDFRIIFERVEKDEKITGTDQLVIVDGEVEV
ncbi:MAG: hypothetical protein V3U75_12800 [Methylococcaceae bacterium]